MTPPPSCGTATRARAIVPVLLAPVTITLSAMVASLAGLSAVGVLVVAVAVGLIGAFVAHRTVSNLVAGAVLLLARPFEPGDRLLLHVCEFGRTAEVEVIRVGLLTTTVATGTGMLVLANCELLAAPSA